VSEAVSTEPRPRIQGSHFFTRWAGSVNPGDRAITLASVEARFRAAVGGLDPGGTFRGRSARLSGWAKARSSKDMNVKQAALKLGVTEAQVRGFIKDGELPYINVGRCKKYPRISIKEQDLAGC
jgi:hypothetical protein